METHIIDEKNPMVEMNVFIDYLQKRMNSEYEPTRKIVENSIEGYNIRVSIPEDYFHLKYFDVLEYRDKIDNKMFNDIVCDFIKTYNRKLRWDSIE